MQFEPNIHTKQVLLSDKQTLAELCVSSSEFASSELASDFDLLKTAYGSSSQTIAHILAKNHPAWLQSSACRDKEILQLTDLQGRTVAHDLAEFQPDWYKHPFAKDPEVLSWPINSLFSKSTVAFILSNFNENWISSLTVSDRSILTLPTSVATNAVIGQGFPLYYDTIASFLAKKKQLDVLNPELFFANEFANMPGSAGNYVAHDLVQQPAWLNSPLSKLKPILKLTNTESVSVAHLIANEKPEILTDEVELDFELLSLKNAKLATVAHVLAANKKTKFRADIWTDKVLKLRSSSGTKNDISVAHALAETSKEWCNNAIEAFDKQILTMSYRDDISSTKYISVAEKVSLRFVPRQEIVMRLISTGAAFKVGSYGYKNQILGKDITEQTSDLIDGSADKLVQLKLASALYSTIVHFVTSIKSAKPEQWNSSYSAASQQENIDQWKMHEANAGNLLSKLVDDEPSLLDDLRKDINCEPSYEFLCRYAALREFDDTSLTLNDNDFSDNPLNPTTLY